MYSKTEYIGKLHFLCDCKVVRYKKVENLKQ